MKPKKIILLSNSQVRVIYDNDQVELFKARGILMKPWGIKATQEGKKTHTRRIRFHGKPGELVYIREPCWEYGQWQCEGTQWISYHGYRYSSDPGNTIHWRKRSSIHMPREAARYWLYIEDVREEHIQDITEEDAKKEGAPWETYNIAGYDVFSWYLNEWDKINGSRKDKEGNWLPYSWEDNPLVKVVVYRFFFQGRGEYA